MNVLLVCLDLLSLSSLINIEGFSFCYPRSVTLESR